MLKVLVSYFTETGNTEKVAQAIYEEVVARGHDCRLKTVGEITSGSLNDYDLVFLGSACHSSDLAKPVKQILEGIDPESRFKLAGFATHATYRPEGSTRRQELYEKWASKCSTSFDKASERKQLNFLGYFSCQGAPSAPIEEFIHKTIITNEDEWKEYSEEVRKHPNAEDLQKARRFAQEVLAKC